MNTTWQFLDTGANTGAYNMQLDTMLARQLLEGTGVPTLRVYRWKPWAISLGCNQSAEDLDVRKCTEHGIDLVRRPTGGRAIFHAEELTYSIVMLSGHRGVMEVYRDIGRALVKGLSLFGVEAAQQRSQPNFPQEYRNPSSVSCFSSSARYEIEWRGRKLVGSAQRRFGDVVLQHGSLLTGPAHRLLVHYLIPHHGMSTKSMAMDMQRRTIDLSEVRGSAIETGELASCIRRGFEIEWGITFHPSGEHTYGLKPDYADSQP